MPQGLDRNRDLTPSSDQTARPVLGIAAAGKLVVHHAWFSKDTAPPPASTWVKDRLDDVPVPPLGLHALQFLGFIPLPAFLLLLLPGILGKQGGRSGRGWGQWPSSSLRLGAGGLPGFLYLDVF